MDRTQRTLAMVLAVQIVLLGLIRFAFPASHAAEKEQPLFPALASMTPQKVEVGDGTGATVTLDRAGGGWTLESPKGYPVSAGKVEKLIGDIEHLSVGRPVVSNKKNHAALKVADGEFERRVRIWEKPEGKPSAELYLGTSPRFQASHVRVGGKDPVYEASGLSSYDVPADAGSWVDRSVLPVTADSIATVGISNQKGSFELEKKDGRWSVRSPAARAHSALDAQKVDNLVRGLCTMSLEAPAGIDSDPAYGLGSPEATVVFTRAAAPGDSAHAAGGALVLRIGGPVPGKEGAHYAARSGFGYAVAVPKYSVDQALGAALTDLLAKK
jgi:hypothetical protein